MLTGFDDKDSALFRHEIAFVFGQIGEAAVAAEDKLIAVVEDEDEHGMVRHEAAEALGSISTEKALEFLKRFAKSDCRIVRESCEVALDQAEYYAGQAHAIKNLRVKKFLCEKFVKNYFSYFFLHSPNTDQSQFQPLSVA